MLTQKLFYLFSACSSIISGLGWCPLIIILVSKMRILKRGLGKNIHFLDEFTGGWPNLKVDFITSVHILWYRTQCEGPSLNGWIQFSIYPRRSLNLTWVASGEGKANSKGSFLLRTFPFNLKEADLYYVSS